MPVKHSSKDRSQQAIEAAFTQLTREKVYTAITVGEIVERAQVGRTTFYRLYTAKVDVLLAIHRARFQALNIAPSSRADWLAPQPTPALIAFFDALSSRRGLDTLIVSLGEDAGAILQQIDRIFTQYFQTSLEHCFSQDEFALPLPLLAAALMGLLTTHLRLYLQPKAPYSAQEMASMAHRLMRSTIVAALW